MPFCEGTTAGGWPCSNRTSGGRRFCHHHNGQMDDSALLQTIGGALLGMFFGGGVGSVIGGLVGFGNSRTRSGSARKKVFVSFDYDDIGLKQLFVGQARNTKTPFDIVDRSLIEAAPERDWIDHADRAIASSDIMMVLVGDKTHEASGVLTEVDLAHERGKRVVQIRGHSDRHVRPVPGAGDMYDWSWNNIEELLS